MSQDLELEERVGLLPAENSANGKPRSPEHSGDKWLPSWAHFYHRPWREWARSGVGFLWACVLFLLPSFISRSVSKDPAPASTKLRPTAYLDGLRGLAAWAVFNQHLATTLYLENGFSWGQGRKHHEIFRLPVVWLLYSGAFAVGLFFVISGYVLSISPLREMYKVSRDPDVALRKTSSAIFRRPIRLLLPTWASNVLVLILVRVGYIPSFKIRLPEFLDVINGAPQLMRLTPPFSLSLWSQIVDLVPRSVALLRIFTDYLGDMGGATAYNSVVWTIPLELRSSFMLYLTHILLYYMRPRLRSGAVLFLIFVGVLAQGYDTPLFWAGFLIAKSCEITPYAGKRNILISCVWWIVLLLGCLIGSFPQQDPDKSPLFSWMIPLQPFGYTPGYRFFTGFGSILAVLAISKIPLLISLLSIPPIQYLGRISFGLYLVQIWIVNGVGVLIYYKVWSFTGKETLLAHVFGFFAAYLGVLGITVWVADIFWRAIDRPSVSLGFMLEKWMYQKA